MMTPALLGPNLDNKEELGFAICTREPNAFFAHFHDRMVGVLTPELLERWLAPAGASEKELLACVRAPDNDELIAHKVKGDITKRRSGDWSALQTEGTPLTNADLKAPALKKAAKQGRLLD
jgi:putative SOS response-associated peptidase YedK